MFLCWGDSDLGIAFSTHPGNQASSRGEAKGKAGNPFQTTQGNRLSCRDQEGRRGSEEAVPGPSVSTPEHSSPHTLLRLLLLLSHCSRVRLCATP